MSRFVDTAAVERISLGPCQCPGEPHSDGDWVEVRKELSGTEWVSLAQGDSVNALALIVVGWNFTDHDGDPVLVTAERLAALDPLTFHAIDEWTNRNLPIPTLPNGSGAPSRNGSRASASLHTRTTRPSG